MVSTKFYYNVRDTHKELFADVLQNKCSQKVCNIRRKRPVLEPLFNKFITRRLQNRCFPFNTTKLLRTAI